MIHEAKMNVYISFTYKKKLVNLTFVTVNVKVQKYTCIHTIETHYDTPKSVTFEIQQSMKTSYETMSEQYKQRISWSSKTQTKNFSHGETSVRRTFFTAYFPYGEISIRQNFLRQNFFVAIFPYSELSFDEISLRRNFLRRNFHGEISYGEISGHEENHKTQRL